MIGVTATMIAVLMCPGVVAVLGLATVVHVVEPSVCSYHCTDGVGVPDAAAANLVVEPRNPEKSEGCDVTTGAEFLFVTRTVATRDVADPCRFTKRAQNDCVPGTTNLSVSCSWVAPGTACQPWPVERDHCTLGVGLSVARACKV